MPEAVMGIARAGELAALAAAQKRADAGDQLAHAEGLGEVVVAADFQADDLVQLGVAGGKEQHGGRGLRAQAAAQLVAVHARQHDIQDKQIIVVGACQREGVLAVVDDVGLVALLFQRVADEFGDGRLVVNDKDAARCLYHGLAFLSSYRRMPVGGISLRHCYNLSCANYTQISPQGRKTEEDCHNYVTCY